MKLIEFIKFICYKDFKLVYNLSGEWVNTKREVTGRVHYMIYYSKFLDKCFIQFEGVDAKDHSIYEKALNKCAELNLKLLNKKEI